MIGRIDVDFNARDENGHVIARLSTAQMADLSVGQRVYLYDPIDRLWGEAKVERLEPEIRIGTFDVDWNSFVDGELAIEGISFDYVRIIDVSTPPGTEWVLARRTANGTGQILKAVTGGWRVSTK